MKTALRLLALCTLAVTPPVLAAPEDTARAAGCLVCHSATAKMLGPTWKDIAARYRGDAQASSLMAERVRAGSKGVWGELPMAATPEARLSDADLATVIEWVLAH